MRLPIREAAAGLDRHHWKLLGALGAASFFEGYDINIVIVALPQIRESFSLTQAEASLWLSVLYLGALPAMFVSRRADHLGRKRLLLFTIWGYTLATVATALAPNMATFAILQFLARAFLIAEVAIAWTFMAEELPAGSRGFGFGALAMLSALGTGLASMLWALLLSPLGLSWRWLYVAALPVLIIIIRLRRDLPESKRFTAAHEQGHLTGNWTEILKPPYRWWLVLACAALFFGELITHAQVFVVDFLQTQRGFSPSTSNLMLIGAGGLAIPTLLYAGALSDRFGRRKMAIAFLLVSAGGPILFFAAGQGPIALFMCLAVMYVGTFGAWPTLGAYGSELFPTRLRAFGGAAVTFAKVGGQFSSFVAAAVLLARLGSFPLTVAILCIGPLLAALVTFKLPETKGAELEAISGDDLIVPLAGELPTGR
jgi:putative MFS transporter